MTARAGDGPFVAALQPVGDDDRRAEHVGVESMGRSLQRMRGRLSAVSDVQGVGVRHEGPGTAFADEGQDRGELQGADMRGASSLAEVELDGR